MIEEKNEKLNKLDENIKKVNKTLKLIDKPYFRMCYYENH
jgi:hypothetical protein